MEDDAKLCTGVDVSIEDGKIVDGFDVGLESILGNWKELFDDTIGFGLGVNDGVTVSIWGAESITVVFVKE